MKNKKPLRFLVPILVVLIFILLFRLTLQHFSISPDASKEECLEIASEYIQKNQPESAIYPLLLAIQKDQDDTQAHFLLAQTYYQTQIYHLARKECETTLVLDAQNKRALDLLTQIRFEEAKVSWGKGDLREAISEFIYVLNNTKDQKLIDSIATLTGGKYKIKRLTNDLFFDNAPSFSHDGKKIVYHSDTSYFLEDYGLKKREVKKSRIFVMDLDGENKMCLSSLKMHPDGSSHPDGCPSGQTGARLSSSEQNLHNEKLSGVDQMVHTGESIRDDSSEQFARFSNDDKKIIYEKENQLPEHRDTAFNINRDIFIKNLNTGEVRRLTNNDTYDGLASFSSDDKEIIFVCDRPGERSSIHILNLDTGEGKSVFFKKSLAERITRKPRGLVLPYCPSLSPDGKKILFHAGYRTRKIFLTDKNGENLKCLTRGQTDDFFPAFSPDGKKIVFVSNQDDQEDLYLVNPNGLNRIRLTYDGGQKKFPTFSPDGNLIVFAANQKDKEDRYFEIYILNLKETIPQERLIQRLEEMLRALS